MLTPIVNLNGTYGPALLKQYTDALSAVGEALAAMRKIECHGRDYPIGDPERLTLARAMRNVEVRRLEDLMSRLTAVAVAVQDQLLAREQTRERVKA